MQPDAADALAVVLVVLVVVLIAGIHDVGAVIAVHASQRDGSAELEFDRAELRPYAAICVVVNRGGSNPELTPFTDEDTGLSCEVQPIEIAPKVPKQPALARSGSGSHPPGVVNMLWIELIELEP